MQDRQQRSPHPPPGPAEHLVRAYLTAMQERDLAQAGSFLADDFHMTFPGSVTFTRLQQLVDWGKTRYRFVKKTCERFDECPAAGGTIVYCYGTLSGEHLNGAPFSAIRFIDRFTVRDGLLSDQMVWNDMAEASQKIAGH